MVTVEMFPKLSCEECVIPVLPKRSVISLFTLIYVPSDIFNSLNDGFLLICTDLFSPYHLCSNNYDGFGSFYMHAKEPTIMPFPLYVVVVVICVVVCARLSMIPYSPTYILNRNWVSMTCFYQIWGIY